MQLHAAHPVNPLSSLHKHFVYSSQHKASLGGSICFWVDIYCYFFKLKHLIILNENNFDSGNKRFPSTITEFCILYNDQVTCDIIFLHSYQHSSIFTVLACHNLVDALKICIMAAFSHFSHE